MKLINRQHKVHAFIQFDLLEIQSLLLVAFLYARKSFVLAVVSDNN